jgi:hypothetical protein
MSEENKILYKRKKLITLPPSENKILNFKKSKLLEEKFGEDIIKDFSTADLSHLYFYHYNCESVNDCGWGCAWRSMQSALKFQLSLHNRDEDISFYNLFIKYGKKDILLNIFQAMNEEKNKSEKDNKTQEAYKDLKEKEFAPYDTENGWAEPFISQLILYKFGFKGELILINAYSTHNYAPESVFNRKLSFVQFKELLKEHFAQKHPAPIIIDDSYSSLSIIGIKCDKESNNIELIIMDPHVVGDPKNGLYIIVLNEQGEFFEIKPFEHVYCSRAVYFNYNKPWMAYIPETKN